MKKIFVAGLACFTATALVVVWVLVARPAPPVPVEKEALELKQDSPIAENRTPAEAADAAYHAELDPAKRLEMINRIGEQPWAGHKTPVLRKALVADSDSSVQLAALEKSIKLAEKYGAASVNEVIRAGLSTGNSKVIQQSLREARKHPSAELVPDLMEIADSKAAYRFLAVDALAFTDDPRAKAKVIEVASGDDGDKSERVRAVALLAKVKDSRSEALLAQLCGSSDDEVRKVAVEALAAYQAK